MNTKPTRMQNAQAIANKLQGLRSTEGRYPVRPDISQEDADRAVVIDELSRLLYRLRREDMSSKDAAAQLYQMADVLSGNALPQNRALNSFERFLSSIKGYSQAQRDEALRHALKRIEAHKAAEADVRKASVWQTEDPGPDYTPRASVQAGDQKRDAQGRFA